MKTLRKRITWLFVALFLLPVLMTTIWYLRQARQQRLDHALIEAITRQDTQAAIALLDQGADANATDKPYKPMTLQSTLVDIWHRMHGDKIPLNLEDHIPAILLIYMPEEYRSEPVYEKHPIINGTPSDNPLLVEALLKHGADPSISIVLGFHVLDYAVAADHYQTVNVLLQHHINPNVQADDGGTPLNYANYRCTRMLIVHGADVNIKDKNGLTALYYAVAADDIARVQLLLKYGAKVSCKDINGNTLLDGLRLHQGHSPDWEERDQQVRIIVPLLESALKKEQAEQKPSDTTATK